MYRILAVSVWREPSICRLTKWFWNLATYKVHYSFSYSCGGEIIRWIPRISETPRLFGGPKGLLFIDFMIVIYSPVIVNLNL